MTSKNAVSDREHLQHSRGRSSRRGWILGRYGGDGGARRVPAAALFAGKGSLSADETVVFVSGVVGVVVGVVFVWWVRRRQEQPELLAGADRDTRRAVRRALRTGRAHDARIHAQTCEAADHTVRNS